MSLWRLDRRVLFFACLLPACGKCGSPVEAPSAHPEPPGQNTPAVVKPAAPLALGYSGPTTDGVVALRNLAEQVDETRAAVLRRPDVLGFRRGLVDGLLAQVSYEGRFSALSDVEKATADALTAAPGPDGFLLRVRYLSAVHRFDEALAMLERAEATEPRSEIATARRSIAIARANIDTAEWDKFGATVGAAHDYPTLTELAIGYSALGQFERADGLYLAALSAYSNVSPFAVAWVQFQRGVMWAESADRPDRARPLYEEAVRRLPGYVSANVHLAELELEAGERSAAIQRLMSLTDNTDDPEPMGRLAQWLADGDPTTAARYRNSARAKWEALLAREPLAFSDHGAEFYLGAGADPARAVVLAELNLANRAAPRAWLLAIDAALANADRVRACALARAVPSAALSANLPLAHLVAETLTGCNPRP